MRGAKLANILLVEDEAAIQRLITTSLELDGHDIRVASSGAEAIEQLKPYPHLIILDIRLPDMDGPTFLAEALSCGYDGKVLIVSAWTGGKEYADLIGVDGYLQKPFDPDELSSTVSGLLRAPVYR